MLHSSYDKIGLNLKFELLFAFVLEKILGPLAVTHHDRNSTIYYNHHFQLCLDGRVVKKRIAYNAL